MSNYKLAYLSSFKRENRMDCNKESNKLKIKAHQMLLTSKPGIRLSAKRMIMAFTINRKSPKVTMVMGRVRMTKIGFTIKLRRLSTMATKIAVV
tara:strand:+ start:37138 stop:37419 length:282 start_codon:yes stop_codon:yes gene_type:complete